MDFPQTYFENDATLEKVLGFLEAIGVDCESYRNNRVGSLQRSNSMKKEPRPAVRGKSMTALNGGRSTTGLDSTELENANSGPSMKDWKRMSTAQTEKVKRIMEKMQALQKEVDIEMKIRDGLDKMSKAKFALLVGRKRNAAENDMLSQIEKSNKKLDVLKHELQKCRLQLAAIQAAASAAGTLLQLDASSSTQKPQSTVELASSVHDLRSPDSQKADLVKVSIFDAVMKSESTKAFYITSETSIRNLINLCLEKFVLPGSDEDYYMTYIKENNEEVSLRPEDFPMNLAVDFAQTSFKLKTKQDRETVRRASMARVIPIASKEDVALLRKQKEVLNEILDTEANYVEDLRLIISVFMKPLSMSVLEPQACDDVFSNITEIAEFHERLLKSINDKKEEFGPQLTKTVLKIFHDEQCEANPKLNKLTLADLLVKPMHRITRYPILLKRLASNIKTGSIEYRFAIDLINKIEEQVTEINESVRKRESEYRINLIDENLDFNNITEV
ncbi:Rho guanine nucleotide exchange factor (GEF) 17 [Quaeritorhiza haematococci]|nr:Rho guanine nucleotide exchange factor (GEF) 17 [Quaeritorhiza haematococci]